MKIKLFSIVALFLGVFALASCDSYADKYPVAPDCGLKKVEDISALYSGTYSVDFSVNGEIHSASFGVLLLTEQVGGNYVRFIARPMSLFNCRWYVPMIATDFTRHIWYDNDKLTGDDISIRGGMLQYKHLFAEKTFMDNKLIKFLNGNPEDEIILLEERISGFRQVDPFCRDEFNPTGQYAGYYSEFSIDIADDEEFERISKAIDAGDAPEWNWQQRSVLIEISAEGSYKQATGQTVMEVSSNVKLEVYANSAIYPNCYESLWKGSMSVSSSGNTWESTKDNSSFNIKGAIVGQDGKILLPKTYTVKKNADGEGGTISGIWFEGTKVPEGQETEIVLEPEE